MSLGLTRTQGMCAMCQWVPKEKVDAVGPDGVTQGNVDLLKDTMCHHLGW
jgi:hypothetical protein